MATGSDNVFPKVILDEQASTPATPASGTQKLFIDDSDHHLKRVDASDTVTDIETTGSGAPTDAQYVVGAANGSLSNEIVVTVPSTGGVIPKVIVKAADETVNNSNTLQDDDHLALAVGANEIWYAQFHLITNSGATPDFKANFSGPAGSTIHSWVAGTNTSGAAAYFGSGDASLGGFGSNLVYSFGVLIINGATPGNLQLRWAQNTANASDTKVLTNSCLLAWKIG